MLTMRNDDYHQDADDDDDDDNVHHHVPHHVPHQNCGALLFYVRFKSVRPDWKFRGCVAMIVRVTAADAGDA